MIPNNLEGLVQQGRSLTMNTEGSDFRLLQMKAAEVNEL